MFWDMILRATTWGPQEVTMHSFEKLMKRCQTTGEFIAIFYVDEDHGGPNWIMAVDRDSDCVAVHPDYWASFQDGGLDEAASAILAQMGDSP